MIAWIVSRAQPLACWTVLCLIGLVAVACSKASNINPDDAARVRKIDATVERIRQAYTGKDPSAFHSLFMPLDSLRKLEEEIQRDFAVYDRITSTSPSTESWSTGPTWPAISIGSGDG